MSLRAAFTSAAGPEGRSTWKLADCRPCSSCGRGCCSSRKRVAVADIATGESSDLAWLILSRDFPVWRPVRLGRRCLPTTRRSEVGECLDGPSDNRPAVIGAVKQIPPPEWHRWSDRPASQCGRHRRRVALRRLEYWTLQTGHVIKEGWPSDAPIINVDHGRLIRFGEGGGIAVPRSPGCVIDVNEHGHLVRRHALRTSRAMGARQNRL